jgi:flagellar biosynthetic protein FliR
MPAWDPLNYSGLISLLTIRVGAALRLAPFLGGGPMPLLAWAGISVAVAAILAPNSGPPPDVEIGSIFWIALAAKELFVGIVIGSLVRIAFFVLEAAGELAGLSTVAIPGVSLDEGARGARLTGAFTLLGTGIFFLVDGHHALIAGFAGTMKCIPPGVMPGALDISARGTAAVLGLFSSAMGAAVLISAPIFIAGIAADLGIGLVYRLAPGMAPPVGAQAVRAVLVQAAVIAALGVVVSIAVEFLVDAMNRLDLCSLA